MLDFWIRPLGMQVEGARGEDLQAKGIRNMAGEEGGGGLGFGV